MSHYVYVLLCADNSLYTGTAKDPKKRLHAHNNTKAGAKYTRSRRPVKMVALWQFKSAAAALDAEHKFKKMHRPEKEVFVTWFWVRDFHTLYSGVPVKEDYMLPVEFHKGWART